MMMTSKYFWVIFLTVINFQNISSDSLNYNNPNNHGSIGLVNQSTARFLNESSFAFTLYNGDPDQKFTMTSYPFDWLEASAFYTKIQGKPEPGLDQDYIDKGFNFKIRLKEEGILPAVALGINDAAGTGFYSSEYIVASYGIKNLDLHFGLGWGTLNGKDDFKNPLRYLDSRFGDRPTVTQGRGGQFQPSRYFSGETSTPFFGVSYFLNEKTSIKLERDTTVTPGKVGFELPKSDISLGLDFMPNENFVVGLAFERGNAVSLRFAFKRDPKKSPNITYQKSKIKDENKYNNLIKNLEDNGIGVNKIVDKGNKLGIEVTQFSLPNLDFVEEVLMSAKSFSNIEKDIIANYKIAGLSVEDNIDLSDGDVVFDRGRPRGFNTSNKIVIRPFLAARESFLKAAILLENKSEYVFDENFFFSSNLKYSIWDNFNDLVLPEPNQIFETKIRSDVKDYLRNFDNGVIIGRAQFDYFITPKKNNHFMITAGILEEMYSGIGGEYLYYVNDSNYAFGAEIFKVAKRDYKLKFGHLDYRTTVGHLNFYYRNYGSIPFDAKISYGKYLGGDVGTTIELSRSYKNGVKFGVFASFTDISTDEFGEGSFDKGVFFNIPIFGSLINYSWRPLTKDPGQKLVRKNNLHDLLVKFKPIN